MKNIFPFILCLITSVTMGQKIALLSKDFKNPIIYTDRVTVEQVSSGYIPIGVKNFDSVYANLKYLKGILSDRSRSKMASFELRAGETVFGFSKIPLAYGDHYNIVITSKFGEVESNFILTKERNNKRNEERLDNLMNYITENRSLFREAYEIQPRIYNIVLIKE